MSAANILLYQLLWKHGIT